MAQILLATDDSTLLDILSSEAEGAGHQVAWAIDGAEAYEMALAQTHSLVLLDMNLRVHSGPETCELLRADPDIPAALPIYLMTDDGVSVYMVEKVGATGIFPKAHPAHALSDLMARLVSLEPATGAG